MIEWEQALGDLQKVFLRDCGGRLSEMGLLLERLERDPREVEALNELRRHFHSLAGSGATYGFPRVSALGQEGEQASDGARDAGGGVRSETLESWRSLLTSIRAALSVQV